MLLARRAQNEIVTRFFRNIPTKRTDKDWLVNGFLPEAQRTPIKT